MDGSPIQPFSQTTALTHERTPYLQLTRLSHVQLDHAVRSVFDQNTQDTELMSWFTALPTFYVSAKLLELWFGQSPLFYIATLLTSLALMSYGFRAMYRAFRHNQLFHERLSSLGLSKKEKRLLRKLILKQRRKWIAEHRSLHA
jgi:hypothetical protein